MSSKNTQMSIAKRIFLNFENKKPNQGIIATGSCPPVAAELHW